MFFYCVLNEHVTRALMSIDKKKLIESCLMMMLNAIFVSFLASPMHDNHKNPHKKGLTTQLKKCLY